MKINPDARRVFLPQIVGRGYASFWKWKGRFRVIKGSRASKKSRTMALWLVCGIMRYPGSNALVIRKVFRTLKDSCFAVLKWAVYRFGVEGLWEMKESPMEMIYKPTGQKILFRGLDDPLKLASITVEKGYLCWMWINISVHIVKINFSNCWNTLT